MRRQDYDPRVSRQGHEDSAAAGIAGASLDSLGDFEVNFPYVNLWGTLGGFLRGAVLFTPDFYKGPVAVFLRDIPEKLRPVKDDIGRAMPLPVRPSVYNRYARTAK